MSKTPLTLLFIASVAMLAATSNVASAGSLRFVGNNARDVDRVTIQVGRAGAGGAGPPADIGATDFTIEFWLRASTDPTRPRNTQPAVRCNDTGYSWTEGNIVLDRDRSPPDARDFGLSIAGGRVAFGVEPRPGVNYTICSRSNVLDGGAWRHIAVQRALDGRLWLYVDGVLEEQANGPAGDLSYPDAANDDSPVEAMLVIGVEKFDLDPQQYPGFRGWIDELRLSSRLQYSGDFTPQRTPFACDSGTVALYHFDEGTGDAVGDACGQSPGVRRAGGSPVGPEWSSETPLTGGGGGGGGGIAPGVLQFAVANYAASESVATLQLAVTRSGGSAGAASVDVSVRGGSATANADFQYTPQTLRWNSGESAQRSISVNILDDAAVEEDETIELELSNATGASLGVRTTSTVTVADNDAPPTPGQLRFASANYAARESDAAVEVTVTRDGGALGDAAVDVRVAGGGATPNADFRFDPQTVSWRNGESGPRRLSVAIIDDVVAGEGPETIELALSGAVGASSSPPTSTTVTVEDNDTPQGAATPQGSSGGGAVDGLVLLLAATGALRGASRLERSCRDPLRHPESSGVRQS